MNQGEIVTNVLYRFEEKSVVGDRVQGELKKINDLQNVVKLMNAGLIEVYRERY